MKVSNSNINAKFTTNQNFKASVGPLIKQTQQQLYTHFTKILNYGTFAAMQAVGYPEAK